MSEKKIGKVAIIADWLIDFGWAELVTSHLLELFPEADIFTSVCFMDHPMLVGRKVFTSFVQNIPYLNRHHKLAGILRPWAFRSFNLSDYDVILSSSSAEAKHAGYSKRKAWAKHFCYCHTPTRYYWSHEKEYENMMEFWFLNPFVRFVFRLVKWWMRRTDYQAAQKVDYFIANSRTTQERIKEYYERESEVIYPGIETPLVSLSEEESLSEKQKDILATQGWQNHKNFYLWLGRCIPQKKFDLLVEAFRTNGKKLILCTSTDNALFHELKAKSNPNIEWKFRPSEKEKWELMKRARAFLFPSFDDFWLTPIEAMRAGTPVIAYGVGGGTESVIENETGIFFVPQTPKALNKAIEKFEKMNWDTNKIQLRGMEFRKEKFQENIRQFLYKHTHSFG